jgi:hypothetical protein
LEKSVWLMMWLALSQAMAFRDGEPMLVLVSGA